MASTIAQMLPPLPRTTENLPNILRAHDTLSDIYRHAVRLFNQEEADVLQLAFHLNAIRNDAVPLLQAIERSTSGLNGWLTQVATQLGHLFRALSNYQDSIQNQ